MKWAHVDASRRVDVPRRRRHRRRQPARRQRRSLPRRSRVVASSSSSTASAVRRPAGAPPTRRSTIDSRAPAPTERRHAAGSRPRSHHRSPTTKSIGRPRLAPEWHGMACVLTVAVIDGERAPSSATSATRGSTSCAAAHQEDHARSLAGRRARRRGRDSPSSRRCGIRAATRSTATSDPNRTSPAMPTSSRFARRRWEPDAALLLCSDGLTDLVVVQTRFSASS